MTNDGKMRNWKSGIDYAIILLFFFGFFVTPIHVRAPILTKSIGPYGYINYPCVLAVLLSFTKIRFWGKKETICAVAWALMCIPMIVSNEGQAKTIPSYFQNLLPVAFLLFQMEDGSRKRTIRTFLLLFDVFIVCFLILGIEEKLSGKYILTRARDFLQNRGYDASEYTRYLTDRRFGSIWGHPLTTSLLFNLFFAINLVYCRAFKKNEIRYTLLAFGISLGGILLASSKTGILICFLLLAASLWKQKKYFLIIIPILIILYFSGAFNALIKRFETTTLTTGRLEALADYVKFGTNRIQWLRGYGSGYILVGSNPDYIYNNAFEFPELMFAYDFGIIFSLLTMIGAYAYCSWRILSQRSCYTWICYSLIFAQISTYNGYSLRNQDICFLFDFISMILLNITEESIHRGRELKNEGEKILGIL